MTVMVLAVGCPCAGTELSDAITGAQTVPYCEIQKDPQVFGGKMIRVRALYQTNFEQSALTAPSCTTPIPMTWVNFEKLWESRTHWRLSRAIRNVKWGVQADVVFVGAFKAGRSFGHMGMYPFELEVYKVEAVRPSGSFRPLPDSNPTPPVSAYAAVSYCELVRNPDNYDGKRIVVRATYRYGFEWQELFCSSCRSERTWLEIPGDADHPIKFRNAPRHQGTINGTFYGRFNGRKGVHGDGGYRYQFELEIVKDDELVSRSGGDPSTLPAAEQNRICDGQSRPLGR